MNTRPCGRAVLIIHTPEEGETLGAFRFFIAGRPDRRIRKWNLPIRLIRFILSPSNFFKVAGTSIGVIVFQDFASPFILVC